jgi:N-acylneuraminate cytidylyltransferase
MKIIIPARLGSKGIPFKNRKLFKYTANSIPFSLRRSVWVTTDDPEIIKLATSYEFNVIERPVELAQDSTSTKETLIHALGEISPTPDEDIIVLYLTYPQRSWKDIKSALAYADSLDFSVNSMLCKKECTSPYLMMFEKGPFGSQVIPHDLYRRQDYPPCFEISHFIIFFKAHYINNLNNNLYSSTTVFYKINDVVDVDLPKDLKLFYEN